MESVVPEFPGLEDIEGGEVDVVGLFCRLEEARGGG